jgi:hypothetical protein
MNGGDVYAARANEIGRIGCDGLKDVRSKRVSFLESGEELFLFDLLCGVRDVGHLLSGAGAHSRNASF